MSDDQIAELVGYLRRQFAPGKPAWSDIRSTIARVRASAK
jgi:nicotinate dehydrogenase subunit B